MSPKLDSFWETFLNFNKNKNTVQKVSPKTSLPTLQIRLY